MDTDLKSIYIGNVLLETPIFLGPMAGVTDLPFRVLCREFGAGAVCTEMISAKAILYHNRNTEELMHIDPSEGPIALQLFGSDPEIVAEAASMIEDRPFDMFDLNMGCPVPKIVNNGEGSALLRDPALAGRIVEAVAKRVKKPVTVKIRKGFSEGEDTAAETARILEASGAAMITVHGRTREQFYSGKADWECIRRVKEAVSVPVIGNGDVNGPDSAEKMLRETGVDGVMIARAARGNPWIFRAVRERLCAADALTAGRAEGSAAAAGSAGGAETGAAAQPGTGERIAVIRRHAKMLEAEKGEYICVREMRKHISWYLAGLPGAASVRREINAAESLDDMFVIIETIR